MQQLNKYLDKYRKEAMGIPFNLRWKILFNWIKGDTEAVIEKVTEPLEVYKVSLNPSIGHEELNSKKTSTILKRCEGARGILYMNEANENQLLPHSVLKRTRIIEVKDVSMKIRIYEEEVLNQLIYLENVLGFLKEVD